tara:strand:- start:54 stop:1082 length:1029 start_codon:yes stop_codon:yes gene_type:complete
MNKLIIAIVMSSFIYAQCLGDVNDDYVINIQDVVLVVNNIIYSTDIDSSADINEDGYVNVLDIVSITNIILNGENTCVYPIDIIYNVHESLPNDWVSEFYTIIDNLSELIPANQNYFDELTIYAWNSSVQDPYPGIVGGQYIGGSDDGLIMVLEIYDMEFVWDHMHRYSVIAHEYFHVYQLSINEPMNQPNGQYNPSGFDIKWLIEGTAAVFESMYVQNYYNYNYFINDLIYADLSYSIHTNPSIFESYNSDNIDINGSSSVFMVLVLAKELIELGHSEEDAFKMIFKDFMLTGARNSNWESYFLETFGFSVYDFYTSLQLYPLNLQGVVPSSSLSLQQIFN